MSEQHLNNEETFEETEEKIPVNDKRRFNQEGERVNAETNAETTEEKPHEPARSARETELENKLRAEIERREAAEAKLVGVQARFEEVKAEMERETQEMRERMRKSLEDRARQSQVNFLITLLPVLDNLNRAIEASATDASFDNLLQGVKGTARSFEQALASVGVEQVESIGTEFNPEIHEAVDMAETEAENDGRITAVYSHGFKLGDRLLRPARVQVGRARAQKAGE